MKPAYLANPTRLATLREQRRVRRIMRRLARGDWVASIIRTGLATHRYKSVLASTSEAEVDNRIKQLVVCANLIDTAHRMHASIITANPMTVSVEDETQSGDTRQWDALDDMLKRTMFQSRLRSIAYRVSAEDSAAVRVRMGEGGVGLRLESNDECFPVGPPGDDGQPTVWERRWIVTRTVGSAGGEERIYLRVERHWAPGGVGRIDSEAYAVESRETLVDLSELEMVPLATALGAEAAAGIPPMALTGATHPLIVQYAMMRDGDDDPVGRLGEHDVSLIDSLVAGFSRVDRVMEMHGQPKLRTPPMADGTQFPATADCFDDPQKVIEYILVNADFAALTAFFREILMMTLIRLEMAPALLGVKIEGGAAAETYRGLEIKSSITLAAAKGLKPHFDNASSRLLDTASQIIARQPLQGWPVRSVEAQLYPELPKGTMDLLEELRAMKDADLIDEFGAIERIHGPAAEEVFARMLEDRERRASTQRLELWSPAPPTGAPAVTETVEPGSDQTGNGLESAA